jgi:hypothetical protein
MARSTRTRKTAGIPAGAWFAAQSFHSSILTQPRFVAPAATPEPADLFAPIQADRDAWEASWRAEPEPADLFAGLEALDPREALMDALEDARIIADRDLERELDYRAAREGDACGRACGHCGRCA